MEDLDKQASATRSRRPWEPPAMKTVGTIGQLLQAGGGKTSFAAQDPGDAPLKPPGGM